MKLSHLHISFVEFQPAIAWFERVLGLRPIIQDATTAVFRLGSQEVAIHPDWGHGDTSMTLAFESVDCAADYNTAIENGAKSRTAPKEKGSSINADIFGPGRLVIEFEQRK